MQNKAWSWLVTRVSQDCLQQIWEATNEKNLLTLSALWRNPVHKLPLAKKKILGLPVRKNFLDPKISSVGEPLSAPGWRRFNLIETQRVAIYCLLRPPWPLTCVPENSFNCHPSSFGALVVYNPGTSGIVKSDKVQASKKLEKAKFSESRRSLERSLIAPQFPLIGGPCIIVSIASHYIL